MKNKIKILTPILIFCSTLLSTTFIFDNTNIKQVKADEIHTTEFEFETENTYKTKVANQGRFSGQASQQSIDKQGYYDNMISTRYWDRWQGAQDLDGITVEMSVYSQYYYNARSVANNGLSHMLYIFKIYTPNTIITENFDIILHTPYLLNGINKYKNMGLVETQNQKIQRYMDRTDSTTDSWTWYQWQTIANELIIQEGGEVLKFEDTEWQNNLYGDIEIFDNTPNKLKLEQGKIQYIIGYIIAETKPQATDPTANEAETYIVGLYFDGQIQPYIQPIEIIDIWSLMLNILTMPFSFISTAFNVTIFEGTPYAFNVSNIFLSLIAIAMFLWILKLILGKADIGDMLSGNNNNTKQKDNKPKPPKEKPTKKD